MKTFRLFSIAALALVMAACSSEDNEIQQPAQQQGPMKFTATITAPNGGTTRTTATAGTGDDAGKFLVTWAVDDKIALVYEDANDTRQKVVANVDAVDAGVATISATLPTAVKNGTSVTLVYPYAILDDEYGADQDGMTNKEYTCKPNYFFTQTGVAPTDANGLPTFDWRDGSGTFSVNGSNVTISNSGNNVTMNSNIAIWKLNLENQIHDALAASELIINCGRNLFGFNISPAASEVYLYMPLPYYNLLKVTGKPLEILAVYKGSNYSYTHSAVDLTAGKIYNSTVTLAQLRERNIYDNENRGPSIKYCTGETWAQAIANHQNDDWSIENSHVHHSFYGDLKNSSGTYVDPTTSTVDPSPKYIWTNFP